MSLVDSFKEFMESNGMDISDIYEEHVDELGCTILSFGEEAESGDIYNLCLVFFDDNSIVEIDVRMQYSASNMLKLYDKLNSLNIDYSGISFIYDAGIVATKTAVPSVLGIEHILKTLADNIEIAEKEFPQIKNL